MPTGISSPLSVYTHHNRAQLIRGGRDYFNLLEWHIEHASKIIFLQTYIFDEDETGQRISNLLCAAAQRGVQVYVLVDGYASQHLSEKFIEVFKDAGVRFRSFEPVLKSRHFYFGRRLHHKVFSADMESALVGGINISDRYNDLPGQPAWLDWALYVEGEAACGLGQICAELWTRSKSAARAMLAPFPCEPLDGGSDCAVRIRRNDWVQQKNQVSRSYLEMFRNAESRIIIMSSYFLPGTVFRKYMLRATQRGVKFKLILAGTSDVAISKNAERFIYRWLLKNHFEIYEYTKNVLHGKLATYDGKWVTVGSYNVNNISAYASLELNIDINNSQFAHQTEEKLNQIIREDCIRVTEESYRTRFHFLRRIIQRISYETIRLIFFLFTFYFKQHRD